MHRQHLSRRGLRYVFEQRAQEPQRAELDRNAEPVVIAPMLADERPISIVEIEEVCELLGCGVPGEASVT